MRSMRPTPTEPLSYDDLALVLDGLRDVPVAEVLDQAGADRGHNKQTGEHWDGRGITAGLIRRVGNYK